MVISYVGIVWYLKVSWLIMVLFGFAVFMVFNCFISCGYKLKLVTDLVSRVFIVVVVCVWGL